MTAHDYLSDDGHVLLLLCTAFAFPEPAASGGPAPFTLSEWNQLAKRIAASPWARPAELAGRQPAELAEQLLIPEPEARRLTGLLGRAGRAALELENLFSRGMWAVSRMDGLYPHPLKETLKHQAPPVLFGAGELRLLQRAGVAVVGSRNIDEAGAAFARELGRRAAAAGLPVVSGGARGSDRLAMEGAIEARGVAFGVLADSLERTIRQPELRQLLLDRQLVLLTPYLPTAGFSVGGAMGRNKVIYGLAEQAVVVSSEFQTGGTWAGATEALKAKWCPDFVRDGAPPSKGNQALLKLGALPLPEHALATMDDLPAWFRRQGQPAPAQGDLFVKTP